MKKKEILKRLCAAGMAALMGFSMTVSGTYAAEEIFSDNISVEEDQAESTVEGTGDPEEITGDTETELSVEDAGPERDEVVAAEDNNETGDTEDNQESTDNSGIFTDGENSAEVFTDDRVKSGNPAEDITVHMTIGIRGSLAVAKDGSVMADREVTVKDLDNNGVLSCEEALIAVHDQYYEEGVAGYSTGSEEDTGIAYIEKFWGISDGVFGWWKNDESCTDLQNPVKDGDKLTALVYKDEKGRSDIYTKFEKDTYTVPVGTSTWFNVQKASYEEALDEYQFSLFNKGKITAYDSSFQPLDKEEYSVEKRNLANLIYYIKFQKTGIYYLAVESGEDENIIPSVVKVIVRVKPSFSDIKFYTSKEAYQKGEAPLDMAPEFKEDVFTGYSVDAPDYKNSFYVIATLSEEAAVSGYSSVLYSNRSGGTTGAGVEDGKATPDIYVTAGGEMLLSFFEDYTVEYRIKVKQHATLKELSVDGLLDRAFDKDVNTYHAYVDSVKITPAAFQSNYTVKINGTEVKSGEEYALPCIWNKEGRMDAEVEVSGEDKISSVYRIQMEKKPQKSTPVILEQPEDADYIVNDTAEPLHVTASAGGSLAYQWYSGKENSTSGGTVIQGADQPSYTPSADEIGENWYYCIVTNKEQEGENQTVSRAAHIRVEKDPVVKASFAKSGEKMPDNGHTYDWKKGFYYQVKEQASPLEVQTETSAEGGEFSYQWYRMEDPLGKRVMSSYWQNESSFIPETSYSALNDKGSYYACEVTYTYKNHKYTTWATTGDQYTVSDGEDAGKTYDVTGVYVFVGLSGPAVPKFSEQPQSAVYRVNQSISDLNVKIYMDGPDEWLPSYSYVTYQWYMNDKKSEEGAQIIKDATDRRLSIKNLGIQDSKEPGSKYYYCKVTSSIQGYTTSVNSNFAKIVVRRSNSQLRDLFAGSGTQEDPYLIKEAGDYQKLYEAVAQGEAFEKCYFRQEEDITLPDGWKPIGITRDGTSSLQGGNNLYAFSGILDGNNRTLTIPEGGLPLLGYVQNTEVRNLNIYGKKIAGYGLVNNFEGVGLSGTAIIIDNVTLKSGSSTLKAGLIGANKTVSAWAGCSSGFEAVIRNCTIEKDVIIGYDRNQDRIGAIAGRMQGTVENCVSYATVYGKNYVGGIIGTRDNAMGVCAVTGSEFYGTVEASGQHAGGIAGGGYGDDASAPNGTKITCKSCISAGNITGEDKVGGILGGDTYVAQTWNNCIYSFKNNSFTGKVKATGEGAVYIGGIIGFYDSLNRIDDIANNYYQKGCGAEKGIGFVKYVDTSCTTHETSSKAIYINTEKDTSDCPVVAGCGWQTGYNRTDDPLGADREKLTTTDEIKPYEESMEISGIYKTEYEPGEELDLTGMTIRVRMSVGGEKTVPLSQVKIEGYNKDRRGEQKVRISYGTASAEIIVKVMKKNPEDIHVYFTLLGDRKHNSEQDKDYHTLQGNNLETWISEEEYVADGNANVLDVLEAILTENGYAWYNKGGNYIASITKPDGTELAEKENGDDSGWMYTLNGVHPNLSVNEQYLEDGDIIVFHYTDKYTLEHDHIWSSKWATDAKAHWHECTYEYSKCDITDNRKKAGYGVHDFVWKTVSKATVFQSEKQKGTCSVCGRTATRTKGSKLKAAIKLNITSITLQKKQSTKAVKVTMANGDSVKSWTVGNKKIATVSKSGVIKAGTKTGTTRVTVTLKSGKKAYLKVKVQAAKVKTTKIRGLKSKVTLKKGQKLALKPVLNPITSQDKVTYASSNKKVATVNAKGVIVAKKKGTAKITVKSGNKKYTIKIIIK